MPRRFCRSSRSAVASLVAVASLATGWEAVAAEEPAPQEAIGAALKLREVDFVYRSSANYLPCDELRNGVAAILRALGARDDVQVTATHCSWSQIPDATITNDSDSTWNQNWDRSTRQQSPMERMRGETPNQSTPLHIRAMMPVPANKQILKEMEQDKARRELISRVTGNMSAALNDPILFAAKRQEVTLSRDTIKLEPRHCELLDQMISGVFRRLDMKVVRKSISCDRHQRSNFAPSATIEALLPVGYVLPGSDKKEKKEREKKEKEEQEAQKAGAATEPEGAAAAGAGTAAVAIERDDRASDQLTSISIVGPCTTRSFSHVTALYAVSLYVPGTTICATRV